MSGHDDWFTAVYAAHHAQIVRFLRGMLGGRGDAADLAQDVFAKLHTSAPPGRDAAQIRFWLFRVARNLAINELKRWSVRDALQPLLSSLLRSPPAPDELALRDEQRRLLMKHIAALSDDQRAALLLREWEEMTYDETAATLQVSVAKVKSDLFRARQALRAAWMQDERRRR
ncbi:MAG TPA: RNA polymerase sigma factor [Thermoanaerobaculia bacterium]|nr:RNA polymerase sigma factor [Thermoanaerobaculia bacterium]